MRFQDRQTRRPVARVKDILRVGSTTKTLDVFGQRAPFSNILEEDAVRPTEDPVDSSWHLPARPPIDHTRGSRSTKGTSTTTGTAPDPDEGGGADGAPDDAQYLVRAANATLTSERVVGDGFGTTTRSPSASTFAIDLDAGGLTDGTGISVDTDADRVILLDTSDTTESAAGTHKKVKPSQIGGGGSAVESYVSFLAVGTEFAF